MNTLLKFPIKKGFITGKVFPANLSKFKTAFS